MSKPGTAMPKGGRLTTEAKQARMWDVLGAILPAPQALTNAEVVEHLALQGKQLTLKQVHAAIETAVNTGWVRKDGGRNIALRPPPASDWRSAFIVGAHAQKIAVSAIGPSMFVHFLSGVPSALDYGEIKSGRVRPERAKEPLSVSLHAGIVNRVAEALAGALESEKSIPQVIIIRIGEQDIPNFVEIGLSQTLGRPATFGEVAHTIREIIIRILEDQIKSEIKLEAILTKRIAEIRKWTWEELWRYGDIIDPLVARQAIVDVGNHLSQHGELPRGQNRIPR